MKTKACFFVFVLWGVITFLGCNKIPMVENDVVIPTDSVVDSRTNTITNLTDTLIVFEYPTRLYKKESAELMQLRAETPYCLDDYGLFTRKGLINWGYSTIQNSNEIVEIAKRTLVQNPKFSNIISDTLLSVKSVNQYNSIGDYIGWTVIFNNQIYQGLEVLNTEIFVMVSDTVTSIEGHHFKDISIPQTGLLPIDSIKNTLIGKPIVYYNIFGQPLERIITPKSITNDIVKKIIFIERVNYLDFRVVWEMPILYSDDSNWIGWYLYVDVLTGVWLTHTETFISK